MRVPTGRTYTAGMKNLRAALVLAFAAACFLSGCTGGDRDLLGSVKEISVPAMGESSEPNLAAGPNGEMYLSWMEVSNTGARTLKFATRSTDGWAEPRMIVQGDTLFLNWADFPSLFALPDGGLVAHWLSTIPEGDGYNINIATSRDKGATWSAPITPHRDGTPTEHGFVSFVPANGGVAVLWLDSRKLEKGSDDVSLMYTNVSLDGKVGEESEIDGRVCECCQPSSVTTAGGGVLAVYRDRTKDEIRDIVITRFDGKQWSAPKTVFDDHWLIFACPIQGPAISAMGDMVAVAWFTAATEKPKVQLALSVDSGKSFGSPIQVDEGDPVGRVDVVALDSGGAIVTWIEHTTRGGEVRSRQVASDGKLHDPVTIGKTSVGNASGFPRVERSGNSIYFAWTDTDDHRIRTAVAAQ